MLRTETTRITLIQKKNTDALIARVAHVQNLGQVGGTILSECMQITKL